MQRRFAPIGTRTVRLAVGLGLVTAVVAAGPRPAHDALRRCRRRPLSGPPYYRQIDAVLIRALARWTHNGRLRVYARRWANYIR